jgi:hypothetical protein
VDFEELVATPAERGAARRAIVTFRAIYALLYLEATWNFRHNAFSLEHLDRGDDMSPGCTRGESRPFRQRDRLNYRGKVWA